MEDNDLTVKDLIYLERDKQKHAEAMRSAGDVIGFSKMHMESNILRRNAFAIDPQKFEAIMRAIAYLEGDNWRS